MDKKLIKYALVMGLVIILSGLFITASFAIDLPWEKEKKEETPQGLPPPPKIPDDISKPPSETPAPPSPKTAPPPTPQSPIQGNVYNVGGDYICNYGKVRTVPPVTPGNKSMRVEQSGDRLTFIDETGKQSSGRLVDGDVLLAYDWQYGGKGHLGINVDGTFYRCKDAISRFKQPENVDWNFILWESGTICARPWRTP